MASNLIIKIDTLREEMSTCDVSEHLQNYLKWIQRSREKIMDAPIKYDLRALLESPLRRPHMIGQLCGELNDIVEVRLAKRLYDRLPSMLANGISSLQVALEDELLTEVYQKGSLSHAYPQFSRILDLLAHKDSRMKIIEIGAGTGGATRFAMLTLHTATSSKRCREYTFIDVTTAFFTRAENEFSREKSLTFQK